MAEVDITTGPEGGGPSEASFSYSVEWKATELPFERRMEKYSQHSFLPQHMEIHWFSIVNSCVTVLLLTAFLSTILMRTLRKDISLFSKEQDLDGAEDEGAGSTFTATSSGPHRTRPSSAPSSARAHRFSQWSFRSSCSRWWVSST